MNDIESGVYQNRTLAKINMTKQQVRQICEIYWQNGWLFMYLISDKIKCFFFTFVYEVVVVYTLLLRESVKAMKEWACFGEEAVRK